MIQEIAIEKLKIHPQNVRKTYTGIEELADSIKAKGILQHLTVVKAPDDPESYWVVIGNRRLTAARAAGIKTLPCAVVEMQERRYSPAENATRESLKLKEGEVYTLIFVVQQNANKKRVKMKKRMRLIKCYPHHAVFEDNKGIGQSFGYWDIEKLLLGEAR